MIYTPENWLHIQVGLATDTDYAAVMCARLFACARVSADDLRRDGTAARDLLSQYFPDAEYFVNVVKRAVDMLADGGHLFLGDGELLRNAGD